MIKRSLALLAPCCIPGVLLWVIHLEECVPWGNLQYQAHFFQLLAISSPFTHFSEYGPREQTHIHNQQKQKSKYTSKSHT